MSFIKKVHTLSPKRLINRRNDASIVKNFGGEYGLVYFGYISAHDDDGKFVRGLTLSNKHKDLHYCIGSFEGYDVMFVERSDELYDPAKKQTKSYRWHILEIDLKTTVSLPHVFIGSHAHSESFYLQLFTKFPDLRALTLGNITSHKPEFLAKYRVYGHPSHIIDTETLVTPLVTEMIHAHFGSLAIEIDGTSLYVYSENIRLSAHLLEAMLKNGIWLARHIDAASEKL